MSIREHGGAVRYWRRKTGQRAVLCSDGTMLVLRGGRWGKLLTFVDEEALNVITRDPEWEEDTRSAISAAITRTGREARRRSGE